MRLSACIVNWNTRDHLRRCLMSIRESRLSGPTEVVVVDNASSDRSARMVQEEFPDAILIANEENLYYAAGNNQAIDRAQGDFIALLNPDVILPPDGLEALCRFLESHEDAAAVAPRLILPDGSVQRSVRGFPGPFEVICEATLLSRLIPHNRTFARYWLPDFGYDEVRAVAQPMASCLVFRGSVLRDLGGLDPAFPMFFNDVDLCLRAHQAGWRVYFSPEVDVQHHHGASTSQVRRSMVLASNRGLLRYLRKHHRPHPLSPGYLAAAAVVHLTGLVKWLLTPPSRR